MIEGYYTVGIRVSTAAVTAMPVRLAPLWVVALAAVAAKQPQLDSSDRGRDSFYDALAHFHSTLFELAQGTASAVTSSCGACFGPPSALRASAAPSGLAARDPPWRPLRRGAPV